MAEAYFAQFTDIHVGGTGFLAEEASRNLRAALEEIKNLSPIPDFVLVTGDLVNSGTEEELLRYKELVEGFSVKLLNVPSGSHDIWKDYEAWGRVIGKYRQRFDCAGVRFLLMDERYEKVNGTWRARVTEEQMEWIKKELEEWKPNPSIIAFHSPILPQNGDYADVWKGSNADDFLEMLSKYDVIALITGHWHRNSEWNVGGIRLINTGALMGQQWTGIPPHYFFPTRPGYRIFWVSGRELRTFWRDLRTNVQVHIVWCGEAHTMGPRPQVRPPILFKKAPLIAKAYAQNEDVTKVFWTLCSRKIYAPLEEISRLEWKVIKWLPMRRSFAKLWSEWEGEIEPQEFDEGDYALVLKAESASGKLAYDGVPLVIRHGSSKATAVAGPETVFEMFYLPE